MILETSFILNLWKGEETAVGKAKEIDASGGPVYIPTPALFELWEGVARSKRPKDEITRISHFLESHDILPFSDQDAREAGLISGKLSRAGRMMGTIDVLIAGMAKARGETLLTSDRRFSELSGDIDVELC